LVNERHPADLIPNYESRSDLPWRRELYKGILNIQSMDALAIIKTAHPSWQP